MGELSFGRFYTYEDRNDSKSLIFAAQVPMDGLEALAVSCRGVAFTATPAHPPGIAIKTPDGDEEVAEVGDYIISDLAGGFRVIDKEIFEAQYVR